MELSSTSLFGIHFRTPYNRRAWKKVFILGFIITTLSIISMLISVVSDFYIYGILANFVPVTVFIVIYLALYHKALAKEIF